MANIYILIVTSCHNQGLLTQVFMVSIGTTVPYILNTWTVVQFTVLNIFEIKEEIKKLMAT